jgi:hypothetical protein
LILIDFNGFFIDVLIACLIDCLIDCYVCSHLFSLMFIVFNMMFVDVVVVSAKSVSRAAWVGSLIRIAPTTQHRPLLDLVGY